MLKIVLLVLESLAVLVSVSMLTFFVAVIAMVIFENIVYYTKKMRYGKVEGKIVDKTKVISFRDPNSYNYYIIIEKEKGSKTVTRKLHVSDIDYYRLKKGDYLNEDDSKEIINE